MGQGQAKSGGWAARPTLSRRGMLSPLLELYFAKSNAVSPLCVERREGGRVRAMSGGAGTAQAHLHRRDSP